MWPIPKITKLKIKAKRRNWMESVGVLYLLGPNRRSFRPLKLPKSTLLEKGVFSPFGWFSNCNGKNELSTSIYRLFWPLFPLFGPLCIFSRLGDYSISLMSFLLVVPILFFFWFGNFWDGSHFWVSFGKIHFLQLFAYKLIFHSHFLHLIVFFSFP